jgi:hypothetical protein
MLIVIALAITIGLVGGWVYAGCPLPRKASALLLPGRVPDAERLASDAVSSAPARGASPARP